MTEDEWHADDYDPGYDPADDWLDNAIADFQHSTNPDRALVTTEELQDEDQDPELDQFLAEPEPDYDWLVPGVIERGDRTILTGGEGAGKSTLLRQIGVQVASGIHPFTLDPIDPVNVLLVDLENSRRQTKRQMRPLRLAAGNSYPAAHMRIIVHTSGLNLTEPTDMVWLSQRIETNKPDLVIIGPIYKMATADPTEEKPARTVIACLDHIRELYGVAMLIEAHSPHATGGGTRPTRPYGASIWMRWPEFGLHITETGQVKHWRGDRDERQWPAALTRGGAWPWTVAPDSDQTFASVVECVTGHGGPMSYGEIAKALGCSKTWVAKVVKTNQRQWDDLRDRIGGVWP
jgi:RecA-family ATPase